MTKFPNLLLVLSLLLLASISHAAENSVSQLPSWQSLMFEQKAFWATAKSRLEILPVADKPSEFILDVKSSVVDNSEQLQVTFDATSGNVIYRSRISSGKEKRMKSYQYNPDYIIRERRNQPKDSGAAPAQWPVTNTQYLKYPASAGDTVVSSPYMLLLLASQLQAKGPNQSQEVIVLTDLNFYRVKLTSGNGIPVEADYKLASGEKISGTFQTNAVAIQASPEGTLEDKDDFSVLGLTGEIIMLFDRNTGLLLQIRGDAPRIGSTEIQLKSATLWGGGPQ